MLPTPRQVFEKQIDCLRRADRESQLELYAEDLIYRFPFATDREQQIVGKSHFVRVMTPLWEQADAAGVKIVGYRGDVHQSADDPEVVFAEFAFEIAMPDGRKREIDFVQRMRISGGKIASVTEYFAPTVRAFFTSAS